MTELSKVINNSGVTKNQHYVQRALIDNWGINRFVRTIKKINSEWKVIKKSISTEGVFSDKRYTNELFGGIDYSDPKTVKVIEELLEDGSIASEVNAAEKHFKKIEDDAIGIIKKCIMNSTASLTLGVDLRYVNKLTPTELEKLTNYVATQFVRIPRNKCVCKIKVDNRNDEEMARDQLVHNIARLLQMEVYKPEDILNTKHENMQTDVSKMKEYMNDTAVSLSFLTTRENSFVISDNPVVFPIIKATKRLKGIYMPISPKVCIGFFVNNQPDGSVIKATREDVDMINGLEMTSAYECIVYSASNKVTNEKMLEYLLDTEKQISVCYELFAGK